MDGSAGEQLGAARLDKRTIIGGLQELVQRRTISRRSSAPHYLASGAFHLVIPAFRERLWRRRQRPRGIEACVVGKVSTQDLCAEEQQLYGKGLSRHGLEDSPPRITQCSGRGYRSALYACAERKRLEEPRPFGAGVDI